MKRRLFAILLSLCLLLSLFPTAALAVGSGDTISGTSAPIIIESGNTCDLTIENLHITATGTPAITVQAGATLNLTVVGTNTLLGGAGCAGICVEPAYDSDWNYVAESSAKLYIMGTGTLTVTGGDGDQTNGAYGGGAGIGGNGQNYDNEQGGVDFGTIIITDQFSGTINAAGGIDSTYTDDKHCFGGGAGIGSGGFNTADYYWGNVVGQIEIHGGTINAKSNGYGAGIGGGSGQGYDTATSEISTTISSGTINATGGGTGAGIGGGGLCDGGRITITGGVITATAGTPGEDEPMGGAGIGGGNDASVSSVSITGGTVTARAGGGAAGIGGGTNTTYSNIHYGDKDGAVTPARVGALSISGEDTQVTAYGGTGTGSSGKYGGAGIGAGYPSGNNARSVAFDISITTGATVNACGGYHAQAIGYGYRPGSGDTYYTGYGVALTLDDSITLWAQNTDYYQPALVAATTYDNGRDPVTYSSSSRYLVCYTDTNKDAAGASAAIAPGYLTLPRTDENTDSDETFEWKYEGSTLEIDSTDAVKDVTSLNGNWATLYSTPAPSTITVSYEWVSTRNPEHMTPPQSDTVNAGTSYEAKKQPAAAGYIFDGWYTDEDCSEKYVDGTELMVDTILYGKWIAVCTVTFDPNGGTLAQGTENPVEVGSGETAARPADPTRSGYTFTGWYLDGQPYDFTQPVTGDITLTAGWISDYHPSVKPDDPTTPEESEKPALNTGEHFNYVLGYSDGTIRPGNEITRAEIAIIFFRLLTDESRNAYYSEHNAFTDVSETSKSNIAISTLTNAGILTGYSDGTFRPNARMTRGQLAAIIARFADMKGSVNKTFSDIDGYWAKDLILLASSNGWIDGYGDGTFRPAANITRAQTMAIINRALDRQVSTVEDLLDDMNVWVDNMDPTAWYYFHVQEATNYHEYVRKAGTLDETWTKKLPDIDWSVYQF